MKTKLLLLMMLPFSSRIFFQIVTNYANNETLAVHDRTIPEDTSFFYYKEKSEPIYPSNNVKF